MVEHTDLVWRVESKLDSLTTRGRLWLAAQASCIVYDTYRETILNLSPTLLNRLHEPSVDTPRTPTSAGRRTALIQYIPRLPVLYVYIYISVRVCVCVCVYYPSLRNSART